MNGKTILIGLVLVLWFFGRETRDYDPAEWGDSPDQINQNVRNYLRRKRSEP